MIIFKTRHALKELQSQLDILNVNFKRLTDNYVGASRLVDEAMKLLYENNALKRQNNGLTFDAEAWGLKPEYGPVKKEDIKIGDPTLGKRKKETK